MPTLNKVKMPEPLPGGDDQPMLFEIEEDWEPHWAGMPEFVMHDLTPVKSIYVHFARVEDIKPFSELVGQPVTTDTRSIWWPKAEIGKIADKRYVDEREYDHAPYFGAPDDHGA